MAKATTTAAAPSAPSVEIAKVAAHLRDLAAQLRATENQGALGEYAAQKLESVATTFENGSASVLRVVEESVPADETSSS